MASVYYNVIINTHVIITHLWGSTCNTYAGCCSTLPILASVCFRLK